MIKIAKELAYLCTPHAERLSDFDRINEFCRVGREAVKLLDEKDDEIERLRKERDEIFTDLSIESSRANNAEGRCDILREENARLREALKPFADEASINGADYDYFIYGGINIGDLRAAAAAIREGGEDV